MDAHARLSRTVMRPQRPSRYEIGVTLVELMIAMAVSLVVVIAGSGVYLVSGQAFSTVDSSSQLQDSARFATYIIRRMAQQAGYEDYSQYSADSGRSQSSNSWAAGIRPCMQSDICGYTNLVMPAAAVIDSLATGTSGTFTSPGKFYTDTLVAQFQGQSTINASTGAPSSTADGSIIDCFGVGIPSNTTTPPTRAMSSLYVAINSETQEPELNCSSLNQVTGKGRPAVPLVKGVEVFKVMYEVGNDTSPGNGTPDQFRWVDATTLASIKTTISQPSTSTTDPEVNAWQNVVAVRIGMVLRGDPGTALTPATAVTFYPLGADLASASDPSTTYVAPVDNRLRRVVTFTVHLRNRQNAFFRTS